MNTASIFNDLSQLPPPTIVEKLDYEALLAQTLVDYNALSPLLLDEQQQPVVLAAELVVNETESYFKIPANDEMGLHFVSLSSDPVTKLLQVDSYLNLLMRNRVNHAALQGMPAFAIGANLDHQALKYGVTRLTIKEVDNSVTPPTEAILESDEALRRRMLLSIEGQARGGSEGWYLFNVLSASGDVKDAHIATPSPCEIVITVLSHHGDGTASDELLNTVRDYIGHKYRRVLGDRVTVQSAKIVPYTLSATIIYYTGPSHDLTNQTIVSEWKNYIKQSEKLGHFITDSGVKSALHQQGVYRVIVHSPQLPIAIKSDEAPYCARFDLLDGGNYA